MKRNASIDALPLAFAIVGAVLIGVLVFFAAQKLSPNDLIEYRSEQSTADAFILSYLRTPSGSADVAYLIAQWAETGKFEELLERKQQQPYSDSTDRYAGNSPSNNGYSRIRIVQHETDPKRRKQ